MISCERWGCEKRRLEKNYFCKVVINIFKWILLLARYNYSNIMDIFVLLRISIHQINAGPKTRIKVQFSTNRLESKTEIVLSIAELPIFVLTRDVLYRF